MGLIFSNWLSATGIFFWSLTRMTLFPRLFSSPISTMGMQPRTMIGVCGLSLDELSALCRCDMCDTAGVCDDKGGIFGKADVFEHLPDLPAVVLVCFTAERIYSKMSHNEV